MKNISVRTVFAVALLIWGIFFLADTAISLLTEGHLPLRNVIWLAFLIVSAVGYIAQLSPDMRTKVMYGGRSSRIR